MKFGSSIVTIPLILSGLAAVSAASAKSTTTKVVKAQVVESKILRADHVEQAPPPEPEAFASEKPTIVETGAEEDEKLWDSVSGLFYDNGVFNLEAIDEKLHVRMTIFNCFNIH